MNIAKKDKNIQINTNLFTFIRLLNSMLYFNEALNDIFATLHDHHGNIACFQKEHETENTL